jgi:uncharacterized protein (TIGR01777 family)
MSKHVLLTGGTGLIGKHLTHLLLDQGYTVSHLSRSKGKDPRVKTCLWDISKGQIDEASIDGVDVIVHLAGAGIAEKRWTNTRKKEIVDSRTRSIELIYGLLKEKEHKVHAVISASGISYYGDRDDELLTEDSTAANDFLADVTKKWEAAVDEGQQLGLRIVKFRTGVVLDKKAGALPSLAGPVNWGIGSPLGNGKQWVPWIHWHDVVKLYLYAIMHTKLDGTYNMVSPNPVTNKQFVKAVAKQLHRPLWAPNVPAFLIKLLFGQMAEVVLASTKASPHKIIEAGFKFDFPVLEDALKEIYG